MISNIPIADLLPHDAPMILLDQVEEFCDDFIHASLIIKENIPFFENDSVPAYIAMEYMAQAVAAWNGLTVRQQNKPPKIGFLLGARQLTLHVSQFNLDEKLDVYGQLNYNDEKIAAFDCWVEISGVRVVEAGLNVYQPDQ